jgi:hypothetical protein
MPINVTEFVNSTVQNNPKANAEVKAGASTAAAMFSAFQTGGINASTVLTAADNLPAGVKANLNAVSSSVSGDAGKPSAAAGQQAKSQSNNLGPEAARKEPFSQGAPRALLDDPAAPIGAPTPKIKSTIPQLRESDVKALMVQIAFMETNNDSTYNAPPRIGRYAVHNKTLINYGYKFANGAAFTGKDGVTSEVEFTFDVNVQDRIMERFLLAQYAACIKSGAIKEYDTKEVVAGMLAVSYQFQDANPTLQTGLSSITGLMGTDTSSLQSATSGLAGSLGGLLNSGASPAQASQKLVESSISSIAQNIQSSLPKGSVGKDGASIDKKAVTGIPTITDSATKTTESVKAALDPTLQGSASQLKTAAAKIDVSKLKAQGDDFANSLPATKAKDWRQKGKEKDSKGRPGALFYNAGRFAVQNLGADVSTESSP